MQRKVNLNLLSRYLNYSSQLVVRTDFNVPIRDGKILDLARVKGTHLLIQEPFPRSTAFLPTTPNRLSYSPTSEDRTDSLQASIHCAP